MQNVPGFRRFRWHAGLLWIVAAAILAGAASAQDTNEPTVVLLVRHAEKADEPVDDPPLTDTGRARASALAAMTAATDISAVYATQFLRTQQTVEPIASQLGIAVVKTEAEDIEGLVQRILAENSGGKVLVAGHSDTVPMLVEQLTGQAAVPIEETEYDNLYVVTSWGVGKGSAVRLRYGESSAESGGEK